MAKNIGIMASIKNGQMEQKEILRMHISINRIMRNEKFIAL